MSVEISETSDPLDLSFLTKNIKSERDMPDWSNSPAYITISTILAELTESVKSKPRSCERVVRPIIHKIVEALEKCDQYLQEIEPINAPMRFGNRAFRIWLTKVYDNRAEILKEVSTHPETHEYFVQSFGSWTRIDYGTGHEFSFLAFIVSLLSLGILTKEDYPAIVFDVFWRYWDLIVAVQKRYNQEPAGSHGSWGLDDYVCLPFVFGSSQLVDHYEITPSNVIDPTLSKGYSSEFSYCRWIDYIYQVKKGNFAEHSRMLYSLRNVIHFTKLTGGMLKMYHGEIMDRFLVVQHFRFGELLKWE